MTGTSPKSPKGLKTTVKEWTEFLDSNWGNPNVYIEEDEYYIPSLLRTTDHVPGGLPDDAVIYVQSGTVHFPSSIDLQDFYKAFKDRHG